MSTIVVVFTCRMKRRASSDSGIAITITWPVLGQGELSISMAGTRNDLELGIVFYGVFDLVKIGIFLW